MDQSNFIAIADEAVEHLRRLIPQFPHLVTPEVREAVENWGKFKQSLGGIAIGKSKRDINLHELLTKTALELLEAHQMDDVIEMLAQQFSIEMDYPRLIGLIGKTRYRTALRRESLELQKNSISFEQMAHLWNGMGKPAFGGNRWTAHSVSMLLG